MKLTFSLSTKAEYGDGGLNSPRRYFIFRNRSLPFFSSLARGFFLLSAWVFLLGAAKAAETTYPASTQSNSLDNSSDFARSAAMGSALAPVADDASALLVNPAGLAFLDQGQLFLNSNFWLVGTFQETFLLGLPTADIGGLGVGGRYLNFGVFDGRDESGSLAGTYSADHLDLNLGWGMEVLKGISLGLGVNASQSDLAGTGYTSLSANLGVLWRSKDGIRLGASLANAGLVSPGGTGAAIHLGASYEARLDPTSRLLCVAGATLEPDAVNYLQAGMEYGLQQSLFLRVGYQQPLSDNGIGGLTGLTAGVGFELSGFRFDYAYLPYGDLGGSHRISVGYFFEALESGTTPSTARVPPKGEIAPPLPALLNPSPVLKTHASGPPIPATPGPGIPGTAKADLNYPQVGNPNPPSGKDNSTPPSANAPGNQDSLVLQFDLPSDSGPDGAKLEKEGKYQEAQKAYADAIRKNPQDAGSWWAMGNLYREFHQKTYAVQCFEQVAKLQPGNQKLTDWLEKYKTSSP
jgi:hypothetical protein